MVFGNINELNSCIFKNRLSVHIDCFYSRLFTIMFVLINELNSCIFKNRLSVHIDSLCSCLFTVFISLFSREGGGEVAREDLAVEI